MDLRSFRVASGSDHDPPSHRPLVSC